MLRISSAFEGPTEWGRDDSLEALVPSRAESRDFTIKSVPLKKIVCNLY
jgi:hypothetical protein